MSTRKAAITVHRSREELQRLWREHGPNVEGGVTFVDAPGDRGTEIHVELAEGALARRVGGLIEKAATAVPLAKLKDELRRFKQQVETGEIARSDGTPQGESVARKLRQRPAQPVGEHEHAKAGA